MPHNITGFVTLTFFWTNYWVENNQKDIEIGRVVDVKKRKAQKQFNLSPFRFFDNENEHSDRKGDN